jgi:formate hydrogenlyase transcriptional activator
MSLSSSVSTDTTHARYQTLLEVAEAISAHRQLSTLFNDLSRLLRPLVRFDFIGLTLIDAEARLVRLHVLATDREVVGKNTEGTPFDQTPTIAAIESRRPYYIPEVSQEHRFPKVRDMLAANGVRSACVVPLFTAQRDIGGLHFGSEEPNAYPPEDIEFMEQVARQVAVAVDNALNYEAAAAYREPTRP